jgi:hypothetical protein
MDIVDVVQRDDDTEVDNGADAIGFADPVVDEVVANSSAAVGDDAKGVSVDEVTTTTGPEVIGSGSRRTPPALMLMWTLQNAMSIPSRRYEKSELDTEAWG